MTTLIGRTKEQRILKKLYRSNQAEFLAIYGRRRVGKTFLIKHFFNQQDCVFFRITGIKDGLIDKQLRQFTKAMSKAFYNGGELKIQTNWFDAFEALHTALSTQVETNKKIVLFFDEFPWMATHRSMLLQTLDYFWNQYWSDDVRIKLIICGSSASWIINKVINDKGGLHNRVTRKILLKPFNLKESKEFLNSREIHLSYWHVSQIYMVTGGIPFYLSLIDKGQSAAQIIENIAFIENAPLLQEFDNLFSSLFEDPAPYIELLNVIAKSRYGVSQTDIVKKSQHLTKGGNVSSKLKDLKETGFILRFKSHQNKKKGIYYRIIDEYTLFYFHWIAPIRETLQEESLNSGYWQELQNSAAWHSWAGYAFEAMVYKHLPQVRKKLSIPATAIANTWRYVPTKNADEGGAQIDLLFDRRDDTVTLCEIKYTAKPFVVDKKYAAQLLKKKEIFLKHTKIKKQIFITMIAAQGIKDNPYSDAIICDTATLEDMFSID